MDKGPQEVEVRYGIFWPVFWAIILANTVTGIVLFIWLAIGYLNQL